MTTNGTQLNNPLDPLGDTDRATRELFMRLGKECNAFPNLAVIAAAANLLVNAIRQAHPSRTKAEAAYNELAGRLKGVLLDHYDPVSDKRRNIFPFHQVIEPVHWTDRTKFSKH